MAVFLWSGGDLGGERVAFDGSPQLYKSIVGMFPNDG